MKVTLQDMQEATNPINGTTVTNPAMLVELLERLQSRTPFLLDLIGDNGYRLTAGVGRALGCVQHSRNDGEPPYLMAVQKEDAVGGDDEVNFLAGGTATPILRRQCIPMELLKRVAVHFLSTGERSDEVAWEEV
jgi:hypothetical protein